MSSEILLIKHHTTTSFRKSIQSKYLTKTFTYFSIYNTILRIIHKIITNEPKKKIVDYFKNNTIFRTHNTVLQVRTTTNFFKYN